VSAIVLGRDLTSSSVRVKQLKTIPSADDVVCVVPLVCFLARDARDQCEAFEWALYGIEFVIQNIDC